MARLFRASNSRRVEGRSNPSECGWGIVVVIASHLIIGITDGLVRCCGVFYLSWKNDFNTSAKDTAAAQSIMTSVSCFIGLVAGPLTKRYGCRISGSIGGVLAFLGLFCSFWVNSIVYLYFTVSTAGAGLGISFNAGTVAVALYFKRRYKIANAVAYAGSGTGAMAIPPLLQLLLDKYGWRGAILITSGITANIFALVALFRPLPNLKRSPPDPDSKDWLESSQFDNDVSDSRKQVSGRTSTKSKGAKGSNTRKEFVCVSHNSEIGKVMHYVSSDDKGFKNGRISMKCFARSKSMYFLMNTVGLDLFGTSYRFALLCLLQIELSFPCYGSVLFIIPRAESIGVAPSSAALLLSIVGIGSLLGRLGNGVLISWKVSAANVYAVSAAVAGVSVLLLNVDNFAVLALASFLLGFATGVFLTINVVLTRSFVGLGRFAVSIGLVYVFMGVGGLTGPVAAGWLFDVTESYKTVFFVLAGIYFFCAAQLLLFPLLKRLEPGIDIEPSDV